MIPIPKSIGHLDNGLDLGINSLTDSIGDSMPEVRKHVLEVTMERSSCLDDGLQSRMGCPKIPPLEMSRGPSFSGIAPEVPETLFNCPCPSGLQGAGLQPLKALPVLLREVLLTVKPKILRLSQRLVSHLLQRPMLSLAHRVHGLTHMGHQMVTIKNNLVLRLRHIAPRRGNVGVPNIRGHARCPLANNPRLTARSMRCHASSQLIRKIRVAPRMSHSRSTSIANRSNNTVNREPPSAQDNRPCRTPCSLQLIRGGRA